MKDFIEELGYSLDAMGFITPEPKGFEEENFILCKTRSFMDFHWWVTIHPRFPFQIRFELRAKNPTKVGEFVQIHHQDTIEHLNYVRTAWGMDKVLTWILQGEMDKYSKMIYNLMFKK